MNNKFILALALVILIGVLTSIGVGIFAIAGIICAIAFLSNAKKWLNLS